MKTIDKIKNYYKDTFLTVLDKGKVHGEEHDSKYLAVSLDYIHKYLLKEKVTKRFVARTLFKLCKEKVIYPIPCDYAGNLVFCEYKFQIGRMFCKFEVGEDKILPYKYTGEKDKEWLKIFNSFL